jgi:hypothetical protein
MQQASTKFDKTVGILGVVVDLEAELAMGIDRGHHLDL